MGIDHEERARHDNIKLMREVSDVKASPHGITLLPEYPYIGAPSDGTVIDRSMSVSSQEGLLEIKCPYSVQSARVINRELHSLDFDFLEVCAGKSSLRRQHKYYPQVQGEIAVLGLPWCDFVICTAADHRENILRFRLCI